MKIADDKAKDQINFINFQLSVAYSINVDTRIVRYWIWDQKYFELA